MAPPRSVNLHQQLYESSQQKAASFRMAKKFSGEEAREMQCECPSGVTISHAHSLTHPLAFFLTHPLVYSLSDALRFLLTHPIPSTLNSVDGGGQVSACVVVASPAGGGALLTA